MQGDPLLEQLDCFFTSTNWITSYPNTMVKPLSKLVFDHIPCVISIETNIPRSNLFRFESYWIQHPGFMDLVASSWNKIVPSNSYATIIYRKFKALRYELTQWSKQISKLATAIANSNSTLADLDSLENKRILTTPESNFRRILKRHLLRLLDYQK